jgi:hypothetical protein
MMMIYWDVTTSSMVYGCKHFVGTCLPNYTAPHSKRPIFKSHHCENSNSQTLTCLLWNNCTLSLQEKACLSVCTPICFNHKALDGFWQNVIGTPCHWKPFQTHVTKFPTSGNNNTSTCEVRAVLVPTLNILTTVTDSNHKKLGNQSNKFSKVYKHSWRKSGGETVAYTQYNQQYYEIVLWFYVWLMKSAVEQ